MYHVELKLYLPLHCQWRIQDFPEEGAPTPQGGRQHTILSNFPKNCMKLKEFGPRGGGGGRASPAPPLRFATDCEAHKKFRLHFVKVK